VRARTIPLIFAQLIAQLIAARRPTHEQSTGYYNNDATDVPKRVVAQVLENSFYSKDTISHMVKWERTQMAVYLVLWPTAILYGTDLVMIAIAAQAVFSEQLVSRFLRTEWLNWKCERTYDDAYRLISSGGDRFEITAWEIVGRYETSKAIAGLTLSSRMFKGRQLHTDREWQRVRAQLKL
jgi:hypothetical protein